MFNNVPNFTIQYISEDSQGALFNITVQANTQNGKDTKQIIVPLEDWQSIKEQVLKDNTQLVNWILSVALSPYYPEG